MPQKNRRAKSSPAERLLAWYERNRRTLAWRASAGETPDPYRVWLSEIMLQQTTVAAVDRYFRKFIARWPDIEALAGASLDEVRAAWAGLGYYSRAANLHKTAGIVAGEHGGRFPQDAAALCKLPGIGDYTAGAIAAIAFDAQEAAVDANAERVIARYFAIAAALPKAKPELRRFAATLVPAKRAGDFAQALMDLGALICTPKRPGCAKCPWVRDCRAKALGNPELFPRKGAERASRLDEFRTRVGALPPTTRGPGGWRSLARGRFAASSTRHAGAGLLGGHRQYRLRDRAHRHRGRHGLSIRRRHDGRIHPDAIRSPCHAF